MKEQRKKILLRVPENLYKFILKRLEKENHYRVISLNSFVVDAIYEYLKEKEGEK